MLKRLVFGNIGLFRYKNVVNCEGGLAILVGENGSGKTMMTECIRRCLSSQISQSDSTVPDKSQYSYSFCEFKIDPEVLKQLMSESFVQKYREVLEFFLELCSQNDIGLTGLTCVTGFYKHENPQFKQKCLEFICNVNRPNIQKSLLITKNYCTAENQYNFQKGSIFDRLVTGPGNTTELFDDMKAQITEGRNYIQSETFEGIYNAVFGRDGCVHMIYPHHGIGPSPDTASVKMEAMEENYRTAAKNAELLERLWKKKLSDRRMTQEYDKFLEYVLPGCNYSFDFEAGTGENIVMTDRSAAETGKVPILKTPEGILEIILFGLCIADKDKYRTISYDEPFRCLHPTVIERLTTYLLSLVKTKEICLILPTHSTHLGSYNIWEHIYHFKRVEKPEQDNKQDFPYLRCKPVHNQRFSIKDLRFSSNEHMQKVLFATKVLFVEGESDRILFSQLFDTIKVAPKCSEALKKAVCNLTVIPMGSKSEAKRVEDFCHWINVDYKILLDSDATEATNFTNMEYLLGSSKCNTEATKTAKSIRTFLDTLVLVDKNKDVCENMFKMFPVNKTPLLDCLEDVRKCLQDRDLDREKRISVAEKELHKKWKMIFDKPEMGNHMRKTKTMFINIINKISTLIKKSSEINYITVKYLVALEEQFSSRCKVGKQERGNKFYWSVGALEEMVNERLLSERDPRPLLVREKGHWKGEHKDPSGNEQRNIDKQYNTVWYLVKRPEEGFIGTFTMNEVQEVVDVLMKSEPSDLGRFLTFLQKW